MIEVIIITTTFISFELRYTLFTDYILKEHILTNVDFKDISKTKYELYDIRNNVIHIVSSDGTRRKLHQRDYVLGEWKSGGSSITVIGTSLFRLDSYNCLVERAQKHTITPLGTGSSICVSYYAEIPILTQKLNTSFKKSFCGFSESVYGQYSFEIYRYFDYGDSLPSVDFRRTTIETHFQSDKLINEILTLTVKE